MSSVERYLEVFDGLQRKKRWSTGTNILRFAALTLAASDVTDPGGRLEETARALSKEAGGFSPLSSAIRHAVAAILIRRGLEPVPTVQRVKETLESFKAHRLKKGGPHPLLAALLLVLDAGGGSVRFDKIERMKRIIDRWAVDHRFLTGVDDYPMAAMHAARGAEPEQLGLEVEEIYKTLRRAKFNMGNQLQLVSHLMMFSDLGPQMAAERFVRMAAAIKGKGQRVWESFYDEVALLVLSGAAVDDASTRVIEYRDRLRAVKPRPPAPIAFSIAAGIVLAEEAERAKGIKGAATAANLRAVQAIIEAQQAAMVACIAATTCVTAAAASS
jgi:hypothetical protein